MKMPSHVLHSFNVGVKQNDIKVQSFTKPNKGWSNIRGFSSCTGFHLAGCMATCKRQLSKTLFWFPFLQMQHNLSKQNKSTYAMEHELFLEELFFSCFIKKTNHLASRRLVFRSRVFLHYREQVEALLKWLALRSQLFSLRFTSVEATAVIGFSARKNNGILTADVPTQHKAWVQEHALENCVQQVHRHSAFEVRRQNHEKKGMACFLGI